MTTTAQSSLIGTPAETLAALRSAASTQAGVDTLRAAGYSGGATLYGTFRNSLGDDADPAAMTLDDFSARAEDFFREAGWGRLRLHSAEDALAVVEIDQCWEATAGGREGGCHLTTGALAGFLAPLADYQIAVMEVECARDTGATCRFLAGNTDMLDEAYERLVAGEGWESVAHAPAEG